MNEKEFKEKSDELSCKISECISEFLKKNKMPIGIVLTALSSIVGFIMVDQNTRNLEGQYEDIDDFCNKLRDYLRGMADSMDKENEKLKESTH